MKNKFGFTLPELIVTISIISVLIVVSLYAVSHHFTDFYSRYYTAYDSLNKVAYNTYTDTHCRSNKDLADCKDSKEINEGRPFPKNPKGLCQRFLEYYNVTKSSCSNNKVPSSDLKNEVFYNKANKKDTEYLQFSTTNGFKYYFSALNSINFGASKVEYFIVYIDLNGKGEPNKVDHPIHPDIVPFAVTTTGDVIPIGHPIYDKTYASVRVINYDGKQSISYTMDEARQIAFGNGDPFVDMPITMMRKLDNTLPNSAKRNSMRAANVSIGGYKDPDTKKNFECAEGTFNCTIKIDENMEKRY